MRDAEGTLLVCAPLEPHRVVVPAEHVTRIGEASEAVGATDLAKQLGCAIEGPRRALHVQLGEREGWLLVGAHVVLARVPPASFVALPEWIAGVAERLPVAGLVAFEGRFALELDLHRVLTGPAA